MTREYRDYIMDILDSVEKAQSFLGTMSFEAFGKDAKTMYAVIRAFEIMGEAVGKIPQGVRHKYKKNPVERNGCNEKQTHS